VSAASSSREDWLDALAFPVLCFNDALVIVMGTREELTTATKAGLASGWFDDLRIVGSNDVAVTIKTARKLRGVGPFGGYNIFLNQRIQVELEPAGTPEPIDVSEVRERTLRSLEQWHGWQSRGDYEELRAGVEQARSVGEIIQLVQ
jgi:hypothetical protein